MEKLFSIAGWYNNFKFLIDFLEYYFSNPKYFLEDRKIDSIYDAYAEGGVPLVWSGGRIPLNIQDKSLRMDEILNVFNTNCPEIKLRHTFTNCLLNDDALINDFRCNKFIQTYIRPQDEIIVNHPKLIEHLKLNYPSIPLIYSTTLGLTDLSAINNLTKNNIYVLNYNKNNDDLYLSQLENKNNIEILCGETCYFNCPMRQLHYQLISQIILDSQINLDIFNKDTCLMPKLEGKETNLDYFINLEHGVSNARIEELSSQGFKYFKIMGRSIAIPKWIKFILYYLAKPEYYDFLVDLFLTRWW